MHDGHWSYVTYRLHSHSCQGEGFVPADRYWVIGFLDETGRATLANHFVRNEGSGEYKERGLCCPLAAFTWARHILHGPRSLRSGWIPMSREAEHSFKSTKPPASMAWRAAIEPGLSASKCCETEDLLFDSSFNVAKDSGRLV